MSALTLAWAARSDTGPVRDHNEDAVFASPRMVAVADGVGGAAAGEVASQVAINALAHVEKLRNEGALGDALAGAVAEGNASIAFIADARPATAGMATTLTVVALDGDCWTVANLGDSRAYLLRDGVLHQLTHDHTLVQSLVDEGRLTADEAADHPRRSVLVRTLQEGSPAEPDLFTVEGEVGDRFLVCSDGVTVVLTDAEIQEVLVGDAEPADAVDRIIELANEGGGPDNITCVVADLVEGAPSDAGGFLFGAAAETPTAS
jgi:PPM family protein phosphatase